MSPLASFLKNTVFKYFKLKTNIMKKLLTTLGIVMLFAISAQAQTEKGNYLIGGTIGNLNLNLQKNNTVFGIGLTPRVAWFIADDFAIGASVDLGLQTGKGFTNVSYGVGPLARYYFPGKALESVKSTRFFAEANVGINGVNTKAGGESVSTNGLGVGIGPGVAWFLNKNIALEAVAKYNLTTGFGNSTTNSGLNVGVGFQIFLPRGKMKEIRNDMN